MIHAVAVASHRRNVTPQGAPATEGASTGVTPASGEVILVVDDHPDVRELFGQVLAEAGYVVVEASDGQEALALIAKSKPALVIMDLTMPVLDGWEATKQIKADAMTSDVFVVAVTAHGIATHLERVREAGADDVLSKPCRPDDLLRAVRRLLGDA